MGLLRRILHILWMEKVSNLEVLRCAGIRKAAYLRHILRGVKYAILGLVISGRIEGKRGIGGKQHSWFRNLRQWSRIQDAETIFQLAETGELRARLESSDRQGAM